MLTAINFRSPIIDGSIAVAPEIKKTALSKRLTHTQK